MRSATWREQQRKQKVTLAEEDIRRENYDREYYLDLALREPESFQPNRRAEMTNELNELKEKRKREKSTIPEERRKKAKLETRQPIYSGRISRNYRSDSAKPTETPAPPPPSPPSPSSPPSPQTPSPPSSTSKSPPSSTSKADDVGESEDPVKPLQEMQKKLLLEILTRMSLKKPEETKEKTERANHEKHLEEQEHISHAQKVLEEMIMKKLPVSVNAYRNKTPPSTLAKVQSTYKASKSVFTMVQHMKIVNHLLAKVIRNMLKERIKVSHLRTMEIARELKCEMTDPRIESIGKEMRVLVNRNLSSPLAVDRSLPEGAKGHPWVEWVALGSIVKEMNESIDKITSLSPNMLGATVYEAFDYIDH